MCIRDRYVANPVPAADALDQELHDAALESALRDADDGGITGNAITPFVLDRIAPATGGASVPANIALVENNAGLAAELASELSGKN